MIIHPILSITFLLLRGNIVSLLTMSHGVDGTSLVILTTQQRSSTAYHITRQSPQSDWRSHSAHPSLLSVASIHWDLFGRAAHMNPLSRTNCSVVPLGSAVTLWRGSCRGKSHRVLHKQYLIVWLLAICL